MSRGFTAALAYRFRPVNPLSGQHRVIGYDIDREGLSGLVDDGMDGAHDLEGLMEAIEPPRVVWVIDPAAVNVSVVDRLAGLMSSGNVIIDGGNSYYRQAVDIAARLAEKRLGFIDFGHQRRGAWSGTGLLPDDRRG